MKAAKADAPRWGYLSFVLFMLYLVRRSRQKDIPHENLLGLFGAVLPTELAHKLLAVNAAVLYKLHKTQTPVLSGWVGSIAGLLQCVAVVQLARMYRFNISAKYGIRETMKQAGVPSHSVENIGDLNLKQWMGVFLPLPQSMALSLAFPGVAKVKTLAYAHVGKDKSTKLLMDVYKHRDTPSNAPILLYVHGGAWVLSDRESAPFTQIFQVAAMKWVVCVIDYRLSPKVAFPKHLVDSKRAIAYLRRHAREELDADPDFIVASGESAGGHLASLLALTADDKSLQPGFEDVDTSIRGCVDTYGVHDFTDRNGVWYYKDKDHFFLRFIELLVMQRKKRDYDDEFDDASPIGWLNEHKTVLRTDAIPPFLITHGTLDKIVPFGDSLVFYEQLQRYRRRAHQAPVGGVRDVFLEIPGAHHAFNYLMSPRSMAHSQAVCAFLDNLYQKTRGVPTQISVGLPPCPDEAQAPATSVVTTPTPASRL